MRDLVQRADQIRGWAMTVMPKVFWLPGMTYPTGEQASVRCVSTTPETSLLESQIHNLFYDQLTQHRQMTC